jgi:hypothetical protein
MAREASEGDPNRSGRTYPHEVQTSEGTRVSVTGPDDVVGQRPPRPTTAPGGASPWQLQVTVGINGHPPEGAFFGIAPNDAQSPSVLQSPHLSGLLRGLVADGNLQERLWVRVGLTGEVDDSDWGRHEQRFPVEVGRAEFDRLAQNRDYRAAREHASSRSRRP